jgi:hypothetical protein
MKNPILVAALLASLLSTADIQGQEASSRSASLTFLNGSTAQLSDFRFRYIWVRGDDNSRYYNPPWQYFLSREFFFLPQRGKESLEQSVPVQNMKTMSYEYGREPFPNPSIEILFLRKLTIVLLDGNAVIQERANRNTDLCYVSDELLQRKAGIPGSDRPVFKQIGLVGRSLPGGRELTYDDSACLSIVNPADRGRALKTIVFEPS